MSNDLISRSAVVKIIEDEIKLKSSYVEHNAQIDIMFKVKEMPTAYDVDKVVEEMQDLLWDCYTDSGVGIDRKTGFEAYKREMERILRH